MLSKQCVVNRYSIFSLVNPNSQFIIQNYDSTKSQSSNYIFSRSADMCCIFGKTLPMKVQFSSRKLPVNYRQSQWGSGTGSVMAWFSVFWHFILTECSGCMASLYNTPYIGFYFPLVQFKWCICQWLINAAWCHMVLPASWISEVHLNIPLNKDLHQARTFSWDCKSELGHSQHLLLILCFYRSSITSWHNVDLLVRTYYLC